MQAAADDKADLSSTAKSMTNPVSAVNFNMGTLVGSYATVAALLDELATVPGVKGIMLTFDDFIAGHGCVRPAHPAADAMPPAGEALRRMTDELDIYRQQGFAQTVGIGEAPALVIVDFVVGFTDPAHFGGGNIGPAIVRTQSLLALARAKGWPIVHTRVVYADDGIRLRRLHREGAGACAA